MRGYAPYRDSAHAFPVDIAPPAPAVTRVPVDARGASHALAHRGLRAERLEHLRRGGRYDIQSRELEEHVEHLGAKVHAGEFGEARELSLDCDTREEGMDTARLVRKPFVSKRGSKRLGDGGQNTFCERGVVIRIGRAYLLRGSTLTSRSRRGVSFGALRC